MGSFDNYNYSMEDRLPEYWRDDLILKPTNRYAYILIRNLVQSFMEKMGVLQPFMIWKTLPEEYDWEWEFEDLDIRLANKEENPNCNQTLQLSNGNHIIAQLPLTKRNVDAHIILELSSLSPADNTEYMPIKEIAIKNDDQILKIKDIDSKTLIEINTKDNSILINEKDPKKDQIEGSINVMKRSPREDPETVDDPLDVNEKCELEIWLPNNERAYCSLYIKLFNPVYFAEQNIRVHTLSAFPIEHIRLYGYMCHQFNPNHQWVYLWEKEYAASDRIVYDRITKQYDCEIFYIEVKIYGLPAPVFIGFPASNPETNHTVFSLNDNLDYWGRIFNIPRRTYRTDISEEEERDCFPKYYGYNIEQDYPYEQRLLNEYTLNDDWKDYINITDTDGNDLAIVRSKTPYIENLYMYTETILPTDILNSKSIFQASCIQELDPKNSTLEQGRWINPENMRYDSKSYSTVSLKNMDEENITVKSYETRILALEYDLSSVPDNAEIKGMELKFKGIANTHADNLYIDERSFLKYTKKIFNDETGDHIWEEQNLPLAGNFDKHQRSLSPENSSYTLGDHDTIFGFETTIDRDSIEKGYKRDQLYQKNKIRFDIGFSNDSRFLDIDMKFYNIQLIVYYNIIKEKIDVEIEIPNRTITYNEDDEYSSIIDLDLIFRNQGEIKEINYNAFVIISSELSFVNETDDGEYEFDYGNTVNEFCLGEKIPIDYTDDEYEAYVFHINEEWTKNIKIGANKYPYFKPGRYDIIVVCGEKIYTEEIYVYDQSFLSEYMEYRIRDIHILKPIEGVNIEIPNMGIKTTDNEGLAIFNRLISGMQYTASIMKEGYKSSSHTFMAGESHITIIDLDPEGEYVIFHVMHVNTTRPIEGANVEIDNIGFISTNSEGIAYFTGLESDIEYSATITKNEYLPYKTTFISGRDHDIYINLEPDGEYVTFKVRDEATQVPIKGAYIEIDGIGNETTNADGEAYFGGLVYGVRYTAVITKEGYLENTDSFIAGRSHEINIYLEPEIDYEHVTCHVKDIITYSAIEGVSVRIENIGTEITDTEGIASFSNLIRGKLYSAIFTKKEYITASISFIAGESHDINMYLTPIEKRQVTITVLNMNDQPIPEATITIEDMEEQSGADGKAIFNLADGTYAIRIRKAEYITLNDSITVNEQKTSFMCYLENAQHEIIVVIHDEEDHIVEGATVIIDETEEITDEEGKALFSLNNGTYPITITKNGYETIDDEILVNDSSTIFTFTLEHIKRHITINVHDANDSAISEATVRLNDMEEITDNSGKAYFIIKDGTYAIVISKTGYITLTENITVTESSTIFNYTLKNTEREVTITLLDYDNEEPIIDATCNINEIEKISNNNGMVTYELEDGEYLFTSEKNGYQSLSEIISVAEDSTDYTFHMETIKHEAIIRVMDNKTYADIQGATVKLNNIEKITDNDGYAIYEIKDGTYNLIVSMENYETYTDTLIMEGADIRKSVFLESTIKREVSIRIHDWEDNPVQETHVDINELK